VGPVGPPPKIDLSYFNFSSTDQAFLMMKILKTRLRKNKTMKNFVQIYTIKKKKKKKNVLLSILKKNLLTTF